MADEDGSKQTENLWPLPKFHFQVMWDKQVMSFQEVSGLEIQSEEITYRSGDSKSFSVLKMPGLTKYGNVTMKRGVFKGDYKFWDWIGEVKMNTIKRLPIVINLLDETGEVAMSWTLINAWPTKVSGTDLKADGNEVAIETIEIAHEGLSKTK
jgi:phage tail-like protein